MSDEPLLGALDESAPTPLGPNSFLRRVVAEPVVGLMVQRALVMDVAHPMVAAGVEDHSRFRSRPWRRAWVTIDAALRLVFGDTAVAGAAARQIYATHDHINGRLNEPVGRWEQGASYTAHDAALLTWVWATLVDSAETAYTRWVGPFSAGEADDFYGDMVAFARFVGIPAVVLPVDRAGFSCYLEAELERGHLGVGAESAKLARHILWFEHRAVPAAIVRVGRVLAVTTLDPRLRETLGLELDADDARYGRSLDGWLRAHYPNLPRARAGLPMLYVALRRPTIGLAGRARAWSASASVSGPGPGRGGG